MTTAALRRRFIREQVRHRLEYIMRLPHDDPTALMFRRQIPELRIEHTGQIALENAANTVIRELA